MVPDPVVLPVVVPGLATVPVFGLPIVVPVLVPPVVVFGLPPMVEVFGLVPMLLFDLPPMLVAGLVFVAGAWVDGGGVRFTGAC